MDIVAELKDGYSFLGDPMHRKAYEEIERLRKQVEFERASLQSAFDEMRKLDGDIERLRKTIETLKEEIYLLNRNQPSGDKPSENS